MKIGRVTIGCRAVLAPMEEHTGYCFRRLAKQFGAGLVTTERVDACDVARRDRRAMRLLATAPDESPCAGQISGRDPATMAEAARVVEELGFALVDLNFECPIRRLLSRGEGGALMEDPSAIEAIVTAVVAAVSIPVTLKLRTGPEDARETAGEVAIRSEAAGAAAIGLHGRSVAQAYAGGPDWGAIARLKQAMRLPVVGSGGIRDASDVLRLLDQTGADAAAIGRGCLGNPWIFSQSRALLHGASAVAPPAAGERGRVLLRLAEDEFRFYGVTTALRRLPRLACYFARPLAGFAEFRREIQEVRTLAQLRVVVRSYFR